MADSGLLATDRERISGLAVTDAATDGGTDKRITDSGLLAVDGERISGLAVTDAAADGVADKRMTENGLPAADGVADKRMADNGSPRADENPAVVVSITEAEPLSRSGETPPVPAPRSENIIAPILPPETIHREDGQVQMITVILRPRRDKARDKLLLRRVFGLMISSPGEDRFAFHIFENGRGHLLEFPNMTTGITPDLVAGLRDLVGTENIRIEPITFQ
jgi:hypothetical protein